MANCAEINKVAVMDKPRILIVDDNPAWREELGSLLSEDEYSVETASSFGLARDKLLAMRYAAIIIDLDINQNEASQMFEGMGLLSGLQFLDGLPWQQGRAIVVSAYGTTENVRQAFKRGAYDFFAKQDLDPSEFLKVVHEVVELWKTEQDVTPRRGLTADEKREYERMTEHGMTLRQELTPEEKKEYDKITRIFLRGQTVHFDVPADVVNPWTR